MNVNMQKNKPHIYTKSTKILKQGPVKLVIAGKMYASILMMVSYTDNWMSSDSHGKRKGLFCRPVRFTVGQFSRLW